MHREEMIVRSGIGAVVSTPPGLDERLIQEAG